MEPTETAAVRQSTHNGSPWRRSVTHGCGTTTHATAREIDVLVAACSGISTTDIGKELFMTARTAREYLSRWHRRLGASDHAELVARSVAAGLIDVSTWPPRSTGSTCIPHVVSS